MVVQSVEELRRRVQNGWRLTRDRKGFKRRGPGGRWERVSRELEQEAARLYAQQRAERGGRARGCEGLLKEKEDECLDRLNECSNTYVPLLLKSLKLIALLDVLFDALAQGRLKGLPAMLKEAEALRAYVKPKADKLWGEMYKALKEKKGLDDNLLKETIINAEL
ncbi:MAG: hypothetical protein L7H09_01905 [Acidilobus sp.]|nr:hypothetical protein [Acidilobus sp.]